MSPLGPTSRSLLAAARGGLADPDAATAARVRAKIAASLVGAAIVTTSSSVASSATTASTATTGTTATTATTATASTTASTATASTATTATASTTATGSTAALGGASTAKLGAALFVKLGLATLVVGTVATTAIVAKHASSPSTTAPAFDSPSTLASDDEPHGTFHVGRSEVRPGSTDRNVSGRSTGPDIMSGRIASGRSPGPDTASGPGTGPDTASGARLSGGPDHADTPDGASSSNANVSGIGTGPDAVSGSNLAPSGGPSLGREVELIDRAMSELRLTHYPTSLATIAIYERETAGRGQLGEDAAAIAIEAHCRLGDAVTDMLDVFDRTWPSSAQRTRLTAACKR